MPGMRCAVYGCNNAYSKTAGAGIIFHSFPRPITIRQEWITRCRRKTTFNPDSSRICSCHFTIEDYERDLKNELLGLPLRRVLKKTAIPTLELAEIQQNYDAGLLYLDMASDMAGDTTGSAILEDTGSEIREDTDECNYNIASTSKISEEKCQDINYEAKYNELLKKYTLLRKTSTIRIKALNVQLKYYKTKCNKQNLRKSEIASDLLHMVLTQNQIDLLSKKKKRVNWTREEIAVAFTLRYYSKKCYLYLRNKLHYPLPSLSSLRKWASQINVSQGILTDVLLMLNLAGESFTPFEKTVVLQFDEVKVKAVEEYDVLKDEVLGPYNQMQVVMARGLFAQWKQPVYIAFDQKMTKEILFNVISELHKISFNVVACVSDCGGSNIGLWNELQVDINNTFFKHPETNKNVYMFADAPHLLKLVRNWLLDKGFQLGDGSVINKTPLQALVSLTDTEVNTCWKINEKHLNCEKSQRQNVKLAAQLLSNTVSTALLHYKPGDDEQMAVKLSNFISDINEWFDIFNSYVCKGRVPSKNAYGTDLENQNKHLEKMIKLILQMRPIGKSTHLQTFQKGMIMSIKSLQLLFKDMKSELDIKYICTYKLNQDSLENFFFQIRSRGGPDEHPSPLSAKHRIRMIILGKNPGILESKVNTEAGVIDEYLSPKVLETAKVNMNTEEPKTLESKSSSFSSSSSDDTINNDSDFNSSSVETTDDALEYIAGYLAKKYRHISNLGDFTHKMRSDHSYNIPSWVQQLSYRGLIKPTDQWLRRIKRWNKYFVTHHGESFRKNPRVVGKLALKIFKKERNMPYKLIKDFCKLRTIIRIKFRNLKAISSNSAKRKIVNFDSSRRKIRKLNKILK